MAKKREQLPLTEEQRKLVTDYYAYAGKSAKIYRGQLNYFGLDDDVRSVVHDALIEAVVFHDPSKGRLAARVAWLVNARILESLRIRKHRLKTTNEIDVADKMFAGESHDENIASFEEILATSNRPEWSEIMRDIYVSGMNQNEIARSAGLSKAAISRRPNEIIDSIRVAIEGNP